MLDNNKWMNFEQLKETLDIVWENIPANKWIVDSDLIWALKIENVIELGSTEAIETILYDDENDHIFYKINPEISIETAKLLTKTIIQKGFKEYPCILETYSFFR